MVFNRFSRIFVPFIAALHFLAATALVAQTNTAYLLNAEDVLRVRVGAWNDTQNSYEEWDGISGNYTVSSSGEISFPMLGNVLAAGQTTNDLMNTIQLQLQVNIGLSTPPAVSIEIATYNPIYVTGEVSTPGTYEFSPDMTVLRAIALAGGYKPLVSENPQIERNLLEIAGQQRAQELSKVRLKVLIFRLEATLRGDDTFVPPTVITSVSGEADFVGVELAIFDAQRDAMNAKIISVNTLVNLLENVITQLSGRLDILTEDIIRTSDNLENKHGLVRLGLARVDEENAIANSLSALQIREVDLTVELLNSEQKLNAAVRESESIITDQNLITLQHLEDAHAKLSDLEASILASSELYAATLASQTALPQIDTGNPWVISIIGKGGQATSENKVTERTELLPGDTVLIRLRKMPSGTQ